MILLSDETNLTYLSTDSRPDINDVRVTVLNGVKCFLRKLTCNKQ